MKKALTFATLVSLVVFPAIGNAEKKLDNLIIYGDGFIFSIKEPTGWVGDTKNAATFMVNVILYKNKRALDGEGPIISVRVNDKVDEDTEKDLQFDMDGYRKKFPAVKFRDIAIDHPKYKFFSKEFYIDGKFHEYVVYLNPGENKRYTFSVSMNVQKAPATPEELEAFKAVIRSLVHLQ